VTSYENAPYRRPAPIKAGIESKSLMGDGVSMYLYCV
jgi:hypothetical protein